MQVLVCFKFNGIMLERRDLKNSDHRLEFGDIFLLKNNGVSSVGNLRWKLGGMTTSSDQALWESSIKSPLIHAPQKQNNQFSIQPNTPCLYGPIIITPPSREATTASECVSCSLHVKPDFCRPRKG